MKRRLLSAALLAVLLDPLALVEVARAAAHECRGQICACGPHCPMRSQRSERPCHGAGASGPGMSSVCDHDQVASLASSMPAVLPAELRVGPPCDAVPLHAATGVGQLDGGFAPEPPPPKAA